MGTNKKNNNKKKVLIGETTDNSLKTRNLDYHLCMKNWIQFIGNNLSMYMVVHFLTLIIIN